MIPPTEPGGFLQVARAMPPGQGAYLEQSSQATFPAVSLMVRSETNAGYSVSQGSRACFNFWAVDIKKKKKRVKRWTHNAGFTGTGSPQWPRALRTALPLLRHCPGREIMHYFLISQSVHGPSNSHSSGRCVGLLKGHFCITGILLSGATPGTGL